MPFSYRREFYGARTFCCCLPVRVGVIIMSLLGIVVAGILSIILWFEVASNPDMMSGDRAVFTVAGLVETLLFVASCLGFVGAIVKKQLFVRIYAYFIYVHFILNVAVASYLLYIVTQITANANAKACQDVIQDKDAQEQCKGVLEVTRYAYYVIATTVLLVELYVALVVRGYRNQLQNEKRSARGIRLESEEAFGLVPKAKVRYSALPDERDQALNPVYLNYGPDFDPYEDIHTPTRGERRVSEHSPTRNYQEENYGGGFWTYSQISSEEKARQQELLNHGMDLPRDRAVEDDEVRLSTNYKSQASPSFPAPQVPEDTELPRYTLSDRTTTPVI